jgi:hypothetical protein
MAAPGTPDHPSLRNSHMTAEQLALEMPPHDPPFTVKVMHHQMQTLGLFKVKREVTVGDVKQWIWAAHAVPSFLQVMRWQGKVLDNSMGLIELLVTSPDLTLRMSQALDVTVKFEGAFVKIDCVEDYMTVEQAKDVIQVDVDIPWTQQVLTYNGIVLRDELKIIHYLTGYQPFELLLQAKMWVFVQFSSGKVLTLTEVRPESSIGHIKHMVLEMEDILPSRQRLFFKDCELDDEWQLRDYCIKRNDTLMLEVF